jgi:hypothetical protein
VADVETDRGEIIALQDEVLIAVTDDKPIPMDALRSLPPWRAVLLARALAKGNLLPQSAVNLLVRQAARVGGDGRLPGGRRGD